MFHPIRDIDKFFTLASAGQHIQEAAGNAGRPQKYGFWEMTKPTALVALLIFQSLSAYPTYSRCTSVSHLL